KFLFAALFAVSAHAKSMSFNYDNTEMQKILKDYSKATGQRFIIDSNVRGAISIFNPGEISQEEAFNQLSSALALNSIGFVKQGDVLITKQARSIQRDNIETANELPAEKPTRMATWVINLKRASAEEVNKQLRILTSKDGELVPYTANNQLLISDW